MKSVLTIAGSDSSGGAGIQADIKTISFNGCYAESCITSLTAQNTTGVFGIMKVEPDFLQLQLDAVIKDIRPDAVKIGMLGDSSLIETTAKSLKKYKLENIVLDPVMISTSGTRLLEKAAEKVLEEKLFPICTLITPNIPEAEALSGKKIKDFSDMETAAEYIVKQFGTSCLIKGGHSISNCNDFYCGYDLNEKWFRTKRIDNPNTHGTGCTLSSAIASNLAKGYSIIDSIAKAKKYITDCIKDGLSLGNGAGPLNHGFALKGKYKN